jgi:hypothetical protein
MPDETKTPEKTEGKKSAATGAETKTPEKTEGKLAELSEVELFFHDDESKRKGTGNLTRDSVILSVHQRLTLAGKPEQEAREGAYKRGFEMIKEG